MTTLDLPHIELAQKPIPILMCSIMYVLQARNGRKIQFEFSNLDIKSSDAQCGQDYLMLRNGASASSPFLLVNQAQGEHQNGRLCLNTLPSTRNTTSNVLSIQARFLQYKCNFLEISLWQYRRILTPSHKGRRRFFFGLTVVLWCQCNKLNFTIRLINWELGKVSL